MLHWLWVHAGIPGTGPWYAFWSGLGSDLGEVTLIGAVLGMYFKHTCHDKGCWRIGRHTVNGTPFCNRHHRAARNTGTGSEGQ